MDAYVSERVGDDSQIDPTQTSNLVGRVSSITQALNLPGSTPTSGPFSGSDSDFNEAPFILLIKG